MARRADADEAAASLKQNLEASRHAAAQRKRVAELEAELHKERRAQVSHLSRLRARGVAPEPEEALVDRRAAEHNHASLVAGEGELMTDREIMLER